jgi:uncharacterized membrane protein (DUF106 family)
MLDGFFDILFRWALNVSPVFGIFVVSLILTLLITIIYKYVTNQEEMKQLKTEIKELQKKMKEHKEDPKKAMEVQKEAMSKNMSYMMKSLKPTLITFLPLILVFSWLRNAYEGMDLNFLGFINSWIWVYIIFSIVLSMMLRKALKVY